MQLISGNNSRGGNAYQLINKQSLKYQNLSNDLDGIIYTKKKTK